MIKTIEKRICDVCGDMVEDFAGSLELKYVDYTGCCFPVQIKREQICIDCCRKLDKAIMEVLKEE